MIATGGLLRYNARRQDSLRAKAPPKPKRVRKKRPQEVVIVRGRIQFCSLSGLVALIGLLVLLVGGVLAAVGYLPQDLLFQEPPEEGAVSASAPAQLQLDEGFNSSLSSAHNSSLNSSVSVMQTLLHRFLDSDRLKVLGPLVMGVGIFLFLCANAVLHENRDKETKVIKLQDIYSTVIDLHQHQHPQTGTGTGTGDQPEIQTQVQSDRPPSAALTRRENGDLGSRKAESNAAWRSRGGGSVKREGGAWRKKGGSVRERSGVFSVFHERRFSLPRGFSLHRRQAAAHETTTAANRSTPPEREAESVEQETLDTSLSVIGSQRPLLLMTSCSSLSPAHNQRRGSMLSHAPCMSSTNRRSSCI